MKKINYKKVLTAVLWITALTTLMASLGFVSKSERNSVAKELNITVSNNDENLFLTEADVKRFFEDRNDQIVNAKYNAIRINELEKALNAHPAVENAEVSMDMNGQVKVEVVQRTPVLRVINKDGESYYIDSQARLMPLNENYTARVLVATGEIFEPYSRRNQFTVDQIGSSRLFSEVSVLDDLLKVTRYINRDSSLTSLIHQVYVNKERELELFPAVGNHRIIFGDANNIAEKFNKLKLFYTQGLNKTDTWNKYATINIKFKNQVVCTKK